MRNQLAAMSFILALLVPLPAQASDIRALPRQNPRGVAPELQIREHIDSGKKKLALLATFSGKSGAFIHNPFGHDELGRDYQVVLVDRQGTSVGTIVPRTSAPETTKPEQWVHVASNGIIGRCFWASVHKENGDMLLPTVPEGDYLCYLVVTKRLLHFPVRPENFSPRFERWNAEWKTTELDEPCCASPPIEVHVNRLGEYSLVSKSADRMYRPFEIAPSVSSSGVVFSRFWIIFEREADLSVFHCNLAEDSDGPDHWRIVRSDGRPFIHLARPITEKGFFRQVTDRIRVPQWGIIGGTRSGIAIPEPPGQYEITAEIDESLYWDRVYDPQTNTRRQPAPKEWATVFRSQPKVVDVPVIPKTQ